MLGLIFLAAGCSNNPKAVVPAATVVIKDGGFAPASITVKRGDTVVFQNQDSQAHWPASDLHPTHGIYPEFDPQTSIEPNKSWSFTFDKVGKWKYHDHLFPSVHGMVTVTE